jgi:hypothetical protein
VLVGILEEIDDCKLQLEFGLVDDGNITTFLGAAKKGSSRGLDRWRRDEDGSPCLYNQISVGEGLI